jgi:hypothetical protein
VADVADVAEVAGVDVRADVAVVAGVAVVADVVVVAGVAVDCAAGAALTEPVATTNRAVATTPSTARAMKRRLGIGFSLHKSLRSGSARPEDLIGISHTGRTPTDRGRAAEHRG